jgi:phage portal protein BeeE
MGFIEKARSIFSPVSQGVVKAQAVSRPLEMQWRWLPNGQVVWYAHDGDGMIKNCYLGNLPVWTILDWKAAKVASAPPLLYKVKDEKKYRKYRTLMKDVNYKNFHQIHDLKLKALEEVEDHELLDVINNPNPYMSGYEFRYGHTVYKDAVGSSYHTAVRDGVNDPTDGKIKELWLPAAHEMVIVSGGIYNPIAEYYLKSNPEKKINAKNVCHIRHFSPLHDTDFQSLYGMSRLYPAKKVIQSYNEGIETSASIYQTKGVRDIIYPKGITDIGMIPLDEAIAAQDRMNQKLSHAGNGGIIANNVELGHITVGFSPTELGILEQQNSTKKDLCALFHVSDIIFGWSEHTTYNNLSESRKISLTDAVLPELEILKDSWNSWLLPSYTKDKDYVIDFDDEYYAELQEDKAEQVKWMSQAPLTANEKRELLGYERSLDLNADKVMLPSNFQLLESMGTESFGDANQDVVNGTFGDGKE